jgi:hypothetical protein
MASLPTSTASKVYHVYVVAALCLFALHVETAIAADEIDSPTGRKPRLLWTPKQQAVWRRMRADNHPWWRLLKDTADRTGTAAQVYGDRGQWATLAYQITGDRKYVGKAWRLIQPVITKEPLNANDVRETFAEYVLLYDWLYPGLTPGQRAVYVKGINRWCEWSLAIATKPYVGGFRVSDCDQTIGQYFGLAFTDLATDPDNPKAGTWLSEVSRDSKVPVGGLDAPAADRRTVRDTIRHYAEVLAAGGEWVESSDYNLGTLKLLVMGAEGVRTATGVDHFPEVAQLEREAALASIYEFTPDLRQAYQWGDEEHPRELRLFKRVTLLGMLAGLTEHDPEVGPYIHQFVLDLVKIYGFRGAYAAEPTDRIFYFYNPYAPHRDWRTALPPGYFAPGRGLLFYHNGWDSSASLFGAHSAPHSNEDHDVEFMGDFQLYRKHEWAITHPLGYGGPAGGGEGTNSMLIAGLSSCRESRGPIAHELDPHGEYAYLAGNTHGQYYPGGYYAAPPTFLHEWTRSLFYLPSSEHSVDTIIVFDRVKADNPKTLPRFANYRSDDARKIKEALALKQWIIHSPVAPTETPEGFGWQTAGGQRVHVQTLLPARPVRKVLREADYWAKLYHVSPREQRFQTRVFPTEQREWDTFLNVVQVADVGARLRNSYIHSADDAVEGVLIERNGCRDALVLFGAHPERRILTQGYEVRWTGTAAGADVYLLDLESKGKWTVAWDSKEAQTLPVSSQGVGRAVVEGAGFHRLTVSSR